MTTQFATKALAEARLRDLQQRITMLQNKDRLDWTGLRRLHEMEIERNDLSKALENWEGE